jgi:hypothetical protein
MESPHKSLQNMIITTNNIIICWNIHNKLQSLCIYFACIRGDLDLDQYISPLSERIHIGYRSLRNPVLSIFVLPFIFLHSILVVVVGFGREGLEHFCMFLQLHLVHQFEFSSEIWLVKGCELITLGCLHL